VASEPAILRRCFRGGNLTLAEKDGISKELHSRTHLGWKPERFRSFRAVNNDRRAGTATTLRFSHVRNRPSIYNGTEA
jgi:hypothetical protein